MSRNSALWKWPRRIVVCVVGGTVLLFGLVLMFTPGPALIVIPIGLGILGLEFVWARRWMLKLSRRAGMEKQVRRVLGDSGVPPEEERAPGSDQDH